MDGPMPDPSTLSDGDDDVVSDQEFFVTYAGLIADTGASAPRSCSRKG